MKGIWLITIALMLASCSPAPYSLRKKGERVVVTIDTIITKDVKKSDDAEAQALGPGAIGVITTLAPVAFREGKRLLEKQAEKFTAEYEGKANDDRFYQSEGKALNIKDVKLQRFIDGTTLATSLEFVPKLSDDKQFIRFELSAAQVNFTKAKLKQNDKTVDLDVSITIQAFWKDADKKYHSDDLGTLTVALHNIEIDKPLSIPSPAPTTGWFPLVPRSVPDGRGTYSVTINVKESDEYGERVKSVGNSVGENQEDILKLLNTLLEKK